MYTYKRTEFSPYELYTVGYNDPNTGWEPESDHATKDEAARRVEILNGGGDPETARKLAEAEARIEELESVLSGCHEWFFRYQPTANIRRPGGRPTPAVTTIQDTLSTGIT